MFLQILNNIALLKSKSFEKLKQKKISGYISNYLSPYLYGYKKGFSSQQTLLSLFELKTFQIKERFGRAVLIDLSKAFDTVKHGLPTETLSAYDFNSDSPKFLHSYSSNRWHRTKINRQTS